MKRTVALGLFSLVLIFAFAAVPVVGILSVSVQNAGGENLTLDIPDSVGTGTVDTPLTKRQLQKKYAKYNTVAEENGKSVVTIFSEEQIDDFNARRNNGEWFWLSTEEMLFLIEDTISLFETYDIVYIRGLDGVLHKYYGLSFFSSEEYFASFGGFDLGVTDASFDLKQDVYETILERAQTLNMAINNFVSDFRLYTNIRNAQVWETRSEATEVGFHFGRWRFSKKQIFYKEQTKFEQGLEYSDSPVFPNQTQLNGIGGIKYDTLAEQVVVIELYDEATKTLVARVRYDNINDPEVINEIQARYATLVEQLSGNGNVVIEGKYRALIFLNGFVLNSSNNQCLRYCPIDGTDLFCFSNGYDTFSYDYLYLNGGKELFEYANSLLNQYLG